MNNTIQTTATTASTTTTAPTATSPHGRDFVADYSTLTIGGHLVKRAPLRGSPYTVYSTMHGELVAGRQISYPSAADCASHIRQATTSTPQDRCATALLDTALHGRIVERLRRSEMDSRQIGAAFFLNANALAPVLSMLLSEDRIVRRGLTRRPTYAASWA